MILYFVSVEWDNGHCRLCSLWHTLHIFWFHGGPHTLNTQFVDVSSDLLFSMRSLVCRFASLTSSLGFSLSSFIISWFMLKVESSYNWLNNIHLVITDLSCIHLSSSCFHSLVLGEHRSPEYLCYQELHV